MQATCDSASMALRASSRQVPPRAGFLDVWNAVLSGDSARAYMPAGRHARAASSRRTLLTERLPTQTSTLDAARNADSASTMDNQASMEVHEPSVKDLVVNERMKDAEVEGEEVIEEDLEEEREEDEASEEEAEDLEAGVFEEEDEADRGDPLYTGNGSHGASDAMDADDSEQAVPGSKRRRLVESPAEFRAKKRARVVTRRRQEKHTARGRVAHPELVHDMIVRLPALTPVSPAGEGRGALRPTHMAWCPITNLIAVAYHPQVLTRRVRIYLVANGLDLTCGTVTVSLNGESVVMKGGTLVQCALHIL